MSDHRHQYTEIRTKETHLFCCSLCGLLKGIKDLTVSEFIKIYKEV